MNNREAIQQARDALVTCINGSGDSARTLAQMCKDAIEALDEALVTKPTASPDQEPAKCPVCQHDHSPVSSSCNNCGNSFYVDIRPTSVTCQIYGHVVGACVECNTHEEAKSFNDGVDACVKHLSVMHARASQHHSFYKHAAFELLDLKELK